MTDKPNPNSKLTRWEPEDEQFWESEGKKVANRNLWVSIPNLLLGFSVWIYWGRTCRPRTSPRCDKTSTAASS